MGAAQVTALRADLSGEKEAPEAQKVRIEKRKAKTKGSFDFDKGVDVLSEKPRTLRLNVDSALSPGLDAHSTWYGMIVDEIDVYPGQPEMRVRDCIFSICGQSLR